MSDMADYLHDRVMEALAAAGIVVAVLKWRCSRKTKIDTQSSRMREQLRHRRRGSRKIHASSGIPSLQQLTKDLDLDAKREALAERLYESGLEQYNRRVNNRDGDLVKARCDVAKLRSQLSPGEVPKADAIGISLAIADRDERRKTAQVDYNALSPQAQIYAQNRRREHVVQQTIARDMETETQRTDYTRVKARIALGPVPLDSISTELPIPWQEIRTLGRDIERPKPTNKPPKQKRVHLMVFSNDEGMLEDKRAQRDGDWIDSDKCDMLIPYQTPIPQYRWLDSNKPPVLTGEAVVVCHEQTSEWETEFWRQGGRLDQTYLRARDGRDPSEMRKAYRRRQIKRAIWALDGLMAIALIVGVVMYLS